MNAAEFLTALYGRVNTGYLEITYLAPDDLHLYPGTIVQWRPMPLGEVDPKLGSIPAMNRKGYGCFFGVAIRRDRKHPEQRTRRDTGETYLCQYPRGTQQDAVYLTAFYADADAHDYAGGMTEARQRIEALSPSVLVQSGGGFQCYLLLDEPLEITDTNRADVKRTLKGIAKTVGSDPHVAELARVMRLPETVNTKPERMGARCEVVEATGEIYTYPDLLMEYASVIETAVPRTGGTSFDPLSDSEIVEALKFIPADRIDYDTWITVLAALTHDFGAGVATQLGEQWSAFCSKTGEVADKVASFSSGFSASPATTGSIVYYAKQYGYTPPAKQVHGLSNQNKIAVRDHISALTRSAR